MRLPLEGILTSGKFPSSITGHLESLADGTHLVTDIITNPGSLLSAHLANGEIRLRDFQK
ncbi:MAG: hypothetical protein KDA91_23420 [Planctomycetaceae bacterium]|nr:hypothetical protein [Planctomycetaceae bacterium]